MKVHSGVLRALCHYVIAAWLPLTTIAPRCAAWFVPALMAFSRPKFTRSIWSWLFVAWALCSVCWAPEPIRAFRVLGCLALFLLLYPTRSWYFPDSWFTKLGFLACCMLLFFVWQHASSLSRNVALTYAPFALTFSLACAIHPTWLLIILSLVVGWVADCDTALLATAGLAFARYIPLNWLKRIWKIMWVVVIASLCLLRNVSDEQIYVFGRIYNQFSYVHRVFIYRGVVNLIDQAPSFTKLVGIGLDASRFVENEKIEFKLLDHKDIVFKGKTIPVHPHNVVLQIALELGFIGLALAMILLWRMPFCNRQQMLVAYVAAAHGLISVGAWQTWWMASVWLAYWLANKREVS